MALPSQPKHASQVHKRRYSFIVFLWTIIVLIKKKKKKTSYEMKMVFFAFYFHWFLLKSITATDNSILLKANCIQTYSRTTLRGQWRFVLLFVSSIQAKPVARDWLPRLCLGKMVLKWNNRGNKDLSCMRKDAHALPIPQSPHHLPFLPTTTPLTTPQFRWEIQ